ncbi:MAG TPA: ClpXP protease specificity-enhancing factor SspB [Hyphomicrobiaceae bacterium]|jgi:hypothetical protein|nr:ClpXP protease specificity-enhancing factor SspB [Hyphomicrobiaceae bacterium]
MTAEREIDYEALAQGAMRGIVRTVLTRVAKSGLPGEHHFYIAFKTDAPGVLLSKRLKEKYPEEMTVVLQHRFWDLSVSEDQFEVKLTFDNVPERLVVPFSAIKVFFDPSVPYGLQFDEGAGDPESEAPHSVAAPPTEEPARSPAVPAPRADKKPRAPRRAPSEKSIADKTAERSSGDKTPAKLPAAKPEPAPSATPKVVSIDAFRKK